MKKNLPKISLLVMLSVILLLGSACTKCNNCTLKKTISTQDTSYLYSKQPKEYCGSELKTISSTDAYRRADTLYQLKCDEN